MIIKKGTVDEFAQLVKGKRNIYCFGAGKALEIFLKEYEKHHLEKNIKHIVDNSKEKQGTVQKYNDKEILIVSPEQMVKMILPDDLILITTIRFLEIIEQLKLYEELKSTFCYIYYFLRMEQKDFDRDQTLIPKEFSAKLDICIPKVIHYCWFGGRKIPDRNRGWMESWKKYCPDYQIIEWNEHNYDISKNLYMKQAYEKGKWAFVSDYARVDIIAQYGGVYLDTDVELTQNIDVLLRNDAFCGYENKEYVAFGLGFGAIKNHKIIEKLRDDYEDRKFVLDNGELNLTACPIYQTELLMEYGLKRNGEFQKLDGITVYPERVLCGVRQAGYNITKKAHEMYSIHHYDGSWVNKDISKQKMKEEMWTFYNSI